MTPAEKIFTTVLCWDFVLRWNNTKKALQQINDKKYDTGLREAGVTDVIKYGVAFCGKKVEIAVG